MKTFAVIMNPKTLQLVAVSADEHDKYNVNVAISIFGDRDEEGAIGDAEYRPNDAISDDYGNKYPRIHSPQGLKRGYFGKGFGFCLYSGAALAAARDDRYEGVHSIVGNRSGDAETLWDSFVVKKYARRETTGGSSGDNCDTIDDYEHCEDISDDNRYVDDAGRHGESGVIVDSQVCGHVSVEICRDEEADFLAFDTVLETGLVLVYQRDSSEGIDEETTETVNGDLIVRARIENAEAATRLYEHLRKQYDEHLLAAFVSRPDVMELLFGQQRLPGIAGYGQQIQRPTRRVPLPPLTDESQALLERWKDIG